MKAAKQLYESFTKNQNSENKNENQKSESNYNIPQVHFNLE